mmetsp:Transcript_10276/g.25701  ORF Transcript_10276/g.25701 Transcript_10276/m.25701 type:complete len:210 (-) Transcript_10276:500-1129(-)
MGNKRNSLERKASSKILALPNVGRQGILHGIEEVRLVGGQRGERGKASHSSLSEPHGEGEEGEALAERLAVLDVGALHHPGLAIEGPEAALSKPVSSGGHAERGGARAGLGFDHLRAGVLDPVRQRLHLVHRQGVLRRGLAQEGQDGVPRVPANDRHVELFWVLVAGFSHKGVGSDDVERRHAEKPGGIVAPLPLQHLRGDRDGGVDRV